MVHVSKGREFIWTKTNYERWKADMVQLIFSEIEKSGVNGVKLSELKKKIDAKVKMEELLKTLEEQNLIVRGKKERQHPSGLKITTRNGKLQLRS